MNRSDIADLVGFLKENLRIEISTKSEYTGDTDGPLYKDYHTIKLMLGDDVLSEEYI